MLEWDSSASNDMLADATLALITGIDHSPASVKCEWSSLLCGTVPTPCTVTTQSHSHTHHHHHPHAEVEDEADASLKRIRNLTMFLAAHFGGDEVELYIPDKEEPETGEERSDPMIVIRLEEADAMINLVTLVCIRSILGTPTC